MEDITRKKQNYLRDQIIDGGLDPGDFVEFLASQRENGEDVEVWSMNSLEDMVEKFKDDTKEKHEKEEIQDLGEDMMKTPEKVYESPAQLSARAQSRITSLVREDSDDEEISNQAGKFLSAKSAKEENVMAEEYMRKTVIDTKDAQSTSRTVGNMSENEKHKKEMLDRALLDKKSTIVSK